MLCEYKLSGTCLSELDTEIRFNIANARQDRAELIRLTLSVASSEPDAKRISNCVIKILRSMMKADLIQFYINEDDIHSSSTEAEFLLNKYSALILSHEKNGISFLIKL